MTSSNIDPVTGRAISGDERDTLGANGPDYTDDTVGDTVYVSRTGFDAGSGDPDVLEDSYVSGTGATDTSFGAGMSSGDTPYGTGTTGDDATLGTQQQTDIAYGGGTADDALGGGSGDAGDSGGAKEKAKQVAGQVGDQAGAVKDKVTEQAAAVKDQVTEKAGQVKDVAVQRAGDVASVTKDELAKLASDARGQIQTLWNQAAGQLREQAHTGQGQLADLVHGIASELGELASKADSDGPVTSLLKQAAYRSGEFSKWLSDAHTDDVLTELRRFARKRPVVFLAGATVAGIVVGRLGRGLMAAAKSESESSENYTAYGTGARYTDGSAGVGYGVTDATAATTGVVTVPPTSYSEVPDFSTPPASTVDTGFPGDLGDDAPIQPHTGGDYR